MNLEGDRLIKLIFNNAVPDDLHRRPELYEYLSKLGTYKVDQLKKEQSRLVEETNIIVEQTEDLAISNYKTFIHTAENARSIFQEFKRAETQVQFLIEKLPLFSGYCEHFLETSRSINETRRLNTLTLKKNAQLLEILELPQLMERCIREGRYEEALELAGYVQKLSINYVHIPIINSIVTSVEELWHTMLLQLVAQLRTDLQLPKCLQILGYLRRMQALGNDELKLKFLQARDTWLMNSLNAIPTDDAQLHLTKTIDVTRINLFSIITQYRAIFPDDYVVSSSYKSMQHIAGDSKHLFQSWLHKKIDNFLTTLQADLQRGVNSYDTLLGQCMYFGLSFSRVGADFRALIAPIFVNAIRTNFEESIELVNENFALALGKFTLINKVTMHSRTMDGTFANMSESEQESVSPPETLLDFHPLAALCNGYLNALNELRLCSPIALAYDVTRCLERSLKFVSGRVLSFYRQEQQAFTGNDRDCFDKLCSCFAYDLVPFVQRCIIAIFPRSALTNNLGISMLTLEQEKVTYLQTNDILHCLKHLLPNKLELFTNLDPPTSQPTDA